MGIYSLTGGGTVEFEGLAGQLPGAANMTASVLINVPRVGFGPVDVFGNINGVTGWGIGVREVVAGGIGELNVVITINGVAAAALPVGALAGSWVLITLVMSGVNKTVYVNGEQVQTAALAGAVAPSAGIPSLAVSGNVAVAFAGYSEVALGGAEVASLAQGLRVTGGTFGPSTPAQAFQHQYDAAASMRPLPGVPADGNTPVFQDTGTLANVPLAGEDTPVATVFGPYFAFGQGVI